MRRGWRRPARGHLQGTSAFPLLLYCSNSRTHGRPRVSRTNEPLTETRTPHYLEPINLHDKRALANKEQSPERVRERVPLPSPHPTYASNPAPITFHQLAHARRARSGEKADGRPPREDISVSGSRLPSRLRGSGAEDGGLVCCSGCSHDVGYAGSRTREGGAEWARGRI